MTTIAESSAQLVSPLRYNANMFVAGPATEQDYETPPGAKYFHTESTRGHRHLMSPHGALGAALLDNDMRQPNTWDGAADNRISARTPQSSVIVRGVDPVAYTTPSGLQQRGPNNIGANMTDKRDGQQSDQDDEEAKKVTKRKKWLRIGLVLLLLLIAIGVGVFVWMMTKDSDSEAETGSRGANAPDPLVMRSSNVVPPVQQSQSADALNASMTFDNDVQSWVAGEDDAHQQATAPSQCNGAAWDDDSMLRSSRGVPIDLVSERGCTPPPAPSGTPELDGTTYYFPSPMTTPPQQPQRPPVDRQHQPPPSSWFGASAPTRGAAATERNSDDTLQTQDALARIYDKKANSVLGGKNQPPYGAVRDEAARHIGWAEMGECGAPESFEGGGVAAVSPIAGAAPERSMNELYQANLADRQFREGSSASTLVTPGQAAQQTIGNNPDLSDKHARGRARAKQISAEATAAIGNIYAKKRQAAAGLSAAAQAQSGASNDVNFDYFDTHTQQPFGGP